MRETSYVSTWILSMCQLVHCFYKVKMQINGRKESLLFLFAIKLKCRQLDIVKDAQRVKQVDKPKKQHTYYIIQKLVPLHLNGPLICNLHSLFSSQILFPFCLFAMNLQILQVCLFVCQTSIFLFFSHSLFLSMFYFSNSFFSLNVKSIPISFFISFFQCLFLLFVYSISLSLFLCSTLSLF